MTDANNPTTETDNQTENALTASDSSAQAAQTNATDVAPEALAPEETSPAAVQEEQKPDFVMVDAPEPQAADTKEQAPRDTEAMWDSLTPASSPENENDADDVPEEPNDSDEATSDEPPLAMATKTGTGPFGGRALGPKIPSIAMMRDEDGNLVPTPPTPASYLFSALSLVPLLPLVILLLAQVIFTLDTRALWFSDEVRYADAYRNMVESGNWLILHLNGEIYPDKPPLFFWFLYGLDKAGAFLLPLVSPFVPWKITITQNVIFFAGVAVSGLLCLLAAHCLAVFVARVDRRTAFASGIILTSGFFFSGLLHYLRMDLLFAAMITFSHVFLYHAWMRRNAFGLMTFGFLCAGAAVLIKGPLGLAFPLLTAIFFLLWEGRIARLFRLDTIWGIICGLAIPGTWLALAWMNAGDVFLNNILYKQILERALDTWHHAAPWYHYLATLPLIFLPWTLVLFFLPWGRIFSKPVRDAVKASRTPNASGTAYLWCAIVPAVVMLSLVSIKLPIYALPLFPPLAILCAKGVLRMRPMACAMLQYTLALIMTILGLALILLPAAPKNLTDMLPFPLTVPAGHMVLGGICLVTTCILVFLLRSRRSEGLLLTMALFSAVFAYPAWSAAVPSLDKLLSPKPQAEIIKKYRDAGYAPASFKIYPGTYSYYAGVVRNCKTWDETTAFAASNSKSILALRAEFWDSLADKPQGFTEVNRQFIAERYIVLVAAPSLQAPAKTKQEAVPPAAAPAAPPAASTPEKPAVKPEGQAPSPVPSTPEGNKDSTTPPAVKQPTTPEATQQAQPETKPSAETGKTEAPTQASTPPAQ